MSTRRHLAQLHPSMDAAIAAATAMRIWDAIDEEATTEARAIQRAKREHRSAYEIRSGARHRNVLHKD